MRRFAHARLLKTRAVDPFEHPRTTPKTCLETRARTLPRTRKYGPNDPQLLLSKRRLRRPQRTPRRTTQGADRRLAAQPNRVGQTHRFVGFRRLLTARRAPQTPHALRRARPRPRLHDRRRFRARRTPQRRDNPANTNAPESSPARQRRRPNPRASNSTTPRSSSSSGPPHSVASSPSSGSLWPWPPTTRSTVPTELRPRKPWSLMARLRALRHPCVVPPGVASSPSRRAGRCVRAPPTLASSLRVRAAPPPHGGARSY